VILRAKLSAHPTFNNPALAGCGQQREETDMSNAPFDPDPECPFCNGDGYTRIVGNGFDQVGRCECTNWSTYAELRRTKGLTMRQAMAEMENERR
jgi:hypothetical protein